MFEAITVFKGEHYFLSNFYSAPVVFEGVRYENNEAAFQAAKCPSRKHEFCNLNPSEAKRLGRQVELRPDWEGVKYDIMYRICKEKFMKFDTALFDSRVFILPKEEVCNCLIWRQQDATRNSIESVGQAYFSHKELHKKTCNQIQDMLWKERNINWNDYPVDCKRGSCCVRKEFTEEQYPKDFLENPDAESTYIVRKRWVIDKEPPIFTQNREYVERWL